jgi:hypothetical protein
MIISKDNNGNIFGWRETYISKSEIVDVSVNGNINTIISRLRDLLDAAETYRRHAFYESAATLHLELAQAMERAWTGFEEILESLDE